VAALNVQVARPPYDSMTRSSHAVTLATMRSDPLSRGIRLVLEGAAVLALLLSLAALLLSVAAAVRDDRVALFDLEAQGVGPPTLRSQLRLRAAIVTAVGLAVAVVIGVVLSTATVGLVQVTASATVPVPPLERHLAWPVVVAGLAGFLLLAALAVALSTRAAFSADLPRRATGEAP
jgi:ABC-type antimicrobial peptide transport system permease subunit